MSKEFTLFPAICLALHFDGNHLLTIYSSWIAAVDKGLKLRNSLNSEGNCNFLNMMLSNPSYTLSLQKICTLSSHPLPNTPEIAEHSGVATMSQASQTVKKYRNQKVVGHWIKVSDFMLIFWCLQYTYWKPEVISPASPYSVWTYSQSWVGGCFLWLVQLGHYKVIYQSLKGY